MSAVSPVLRSELTKLLTSPRVWAVTAVVLALQSLALAQPLGLVSDAVARISPDGVIEVFRGEPEPAEQAILGLMAGFCLQSGLFLPLVAAVIGGQEFRNGQLGLSLLSVPRRGVLVAGKAVVVALYALALAVVLAALSTFFLYLAVKDWNPGLLFGGEALGVHLRFIAFAVLFSLTTLAVTLLARSTLVGVVVTIALVLVTMSQVFAPDVDALLPMGAARNLLLDPGADALAAGPGHGLAVLAGWAVAAVAVAALAIGRRDAR